MVHNGSDLSGFYSGHVVRFKSRLIRVYLAWNHQKHNYWNVIVDCNSGGLSNGVQSTATLPRSWTPTREERLIKFSGIGPVDETGMPIASRSVRQKRKIYSWTPSLFYWLTDWLILHTFSSNVLIWADIFMFFCISQSVIRKICLPSAPFPPFLNQSVNKPRDWYKSMFRQIHKKPEGKDTPPLLTNTTPERIPLCQCQVLQWWSSQQIIAEAK